MMSITQVPAQEMIEAFAFAANKLDETLCLGDVCINDEGQAYTNTITADSKIEHLILTKEVQESFSSRVQKDIGRVEAIMKVMAEKVPAKDPDFMAPIEAE